MGKVIPSRRENMSNGSKVGRSTQGLGTSKCSGEVETSGTRSGRNDIG